MTVRSNIKKVTSLAGADLRQKPGCGNQPDRDDALDETIADDSVRVSVDLTEASVCRADVRVGSPKGGQAAPSVRVLGHLGQMRQIAMRGTNRGLSSSERSAMKKELMRLIANVDKIADGLTRTVPRGEVPPNYDSVEAFFESVFADETLDGLLDPFSAYSLGVDAKSISVD